jgi:hypothetical protein
MCSAPFKQFKRAVLKVSKKSVETLAFKGVQLELIPHTTRKPMHRLYKRLHACWYLLRVEYGRPRYSPRQEICGLQARLSFRLEYMLSVAAPLAHFFIFPERR